MMKGRNLVSVIPTGVIIHEKSLKKLMIVRYHIGKVVFAFMHKMYG